MAARQAVLGTFWGWENHSLDSLREEERAGVSTKPIVIVGDEKKVLPTNREATLAESTMLALHRAHLTTYQCADDLRYVHAGDTIPLSC